MRIVVIGSGLIGVSTAYFLGKQGHQVTVVDRQSGPGEETSFANGSLVTPGMPEPWNAPGCWRVLLGSLARSDAPLQLRFRALPGMVGWGLRFLGNSSRVAFERNTLHNLRLALFSLQTLRALRDETGIEYAAKTPGILKIFRNASALDSAVTAVDRLAREGLKFRRLSRAETVALEPALAPISEQLAGAIHFVGDETGDAHEYCVSLSQKARERGVVFSFGTAVSGMEVQSGRVVGMRTAREVFVADHYVIAAGSYSPGMARPLGISVPVRPAKGYSVTFPAKGSGTLPDRSSETSLHIPIVDDDMHAAVVPVGDGIRVAGTAEFAGFDLTLRPERVQNLLNLVKAILPRATLDPATAQPWCGLRPMSADGVPIIGRTAIPNLWVSTGHGHLGWTMAAGSGQLLAELMSGQNTSVDPAPYALSRFG